MAHLASSVDRDRSTPLSTSVLRRTLLFPVSTSLLTDYILERLERSIFPACSAAACQSIKMNAVIVEKVPRAAAAYRFRSQKFTRDG